MSTQSSLLSLDHLASSSDPDHPYSSWPSIPPNPIGRLALLTPDITKSSLTSIQTGQRLSLDWSIYPSQCLLYGRDAATHHLKRVDGGSSKKDEGGKGYQPIFDDFVHLNTQGSTQWDYFLHYSYRYSGFFYGGLTAEEVEGEKTGDIGVAAIAKAGGVQTRGILIDLPRYFADKGQTPLDPLSFPSSTTIDLTLLKDALKQFKLSPQVGDVLLLRTGFEDAVLQDTERVKSGEKTKLLGKWAGVKASDEVIKWIWETGFVAVGSDNPTFEEWYPEPPALLLHPILLSGMGIMIGELLRLNVLSEECAKRNKWDFFFSSCPLMIEHGVASPPNAVAII